MFTTECSISMEIYTIYLIMIMTDEGAAIMKKMVAKGPGKPGKPGLVRDLIHIKSGNGQEIRIFFQKVREYHLEN